VRRFGVASHVSLEDALELVARCVPKRAEHSVRYKFNY